MQAIPQKSPEKSHRRRHGGPQRATRACALHAGLL